MGDYHQIDVISQSYVYADRDTLDGAISGTCATMTTTVALNIASFGGGESGASLPGNRRFRPNLRHSQKTGR